MDSTDQLKDLYVKLEEVQAQVVQIKSIANTLMRETNLDSAKDTQLRGFTIDGRSFPNSTEQWANGFRAICDILSIIYSDQFDKVLDPKNLKLNRYYFSKTPTSQFAKDNNPYEIRDTGIFVDTFNDSNTKKRIIEKLGELFDCQIFLDYYKPD